MRGLIASPVVILLVAGLGIALCKLLAIEPAYREMATAGLITLVATVLGVGPLFLARGARQYAVSQAALVGTVVHLLSAIGVGAVVYLKVKPGPQFLYWLTGMYWAGLLTVVVCSVQAVKSAPPEESAKAAKPAAKD